MTVSRDVMVHLIIVRLSVRLDMNWSRGHVEIDDSIIIIVELGSKQLLLSFDIVLSRLEDPS